MLIGIDANEANIPDRVGVNRYAYEIIHGIYKLQDEWKDRLGFVLFLKDKPLVDMPQAIKGVWEYVVLPGKHLWILTRLMPHLLLNKEKVDLLFSPSHYTVPSSLIPRVCSIMDLGYLEFSGQFKKTTFWQLKYWTAISILVSKHIIAISNTTKKDIVRHYPTASGKITITPLGFDKKKFNTDINIKDVRRIQNKYSIVDDYILFISTLKPSKNIEGLIDAYALVVSKKEALSAVNHRLSNVKLVIVGKKGWMFETIFEKVQNLGLESDVIFTDFVPEDDKSALIKGAKLVIVPSFWEGFGLVALESLACGVPCVVSNIESLTEIIGKAGVIVDPYDTGSIALGIEKILNMSNKDYNKLVEAGLKQAKEFSWEKAARKTLKALKLAAET